MLKNLNSILFTDNLPTLDIHGYDRDTARVAVNDFINDNKKMKQSVISIIHGIGTGILKEEVHKTLRSNKQVLDYKLFYRNPGQTVVLIDLTEK